MMLKKCLKASALFMLTVLMCMSPALVQAEEQKQIGAVDILSIKNYVERDGWSWDPATKTLTLAGVNMYGYNSYSYTENESNIGVTPYTLFKVPYGTTVIVKEGTVNTLASRISGDCFQAVNSENADPTGGITFTGGGTLNMSLSEICVFASCDVTFKDLTLNFDDADIPVMTDVQQITNGDGSKSYKSTTMTFDNVDVNVNNCTGGFYTYGDYKVDLDAETNLATSSIVMKDSRINMDVKLDQGNERNHHCMLIRNGSLTIDHSTLNMNAYHPAVVVWGQYHANETAKSLIEIKNGILQEDLSIASSNLQMTNSFVHAETFVTKGTTTVFSFNDSLPTFNSDMSFDHKFTNAINTASIKAIHTITFDTLGGNTVPSITVTDENAVGTLPIPTKEKSTFIGWSTEKNATTANVTAETVVTDNMTLYAIWKTNSSGSNELGNTSTNGSTPSGNTFTETEIESLIISSNTDKKDPKGSKFCNLQLKAKGKNKSVKLTWKKVSGATSYVIYGSKCGTQMKKLKTVSAKKLSYTFKKLKKGKYYKYMVVAYKNVNGINTAISISKSAHSTTTGGKYGNPSAIKGVKKTVNVKVGKNKKIKAKLKTGKKVRMHIAKFRYECNNSKIATVSQKGVIKGLKKGSCTIYVYAQNGVCKKVKVKVSK